MASQFQRDIARFNAMYRLPVAAEPSLTAVGDAVQRLQRFKHILREELDEIDAVIAALADKEAAPVDALTDLADLLGDIQVYCASEMCKFGLPLDDTLRIIMQSNFSKLDANGQPIYDDRGKVLKGERYWRPEPKIRALLSSLASAPAPAAMPEPTPSSAYLQAAAQVRAEIDRADWGGAAWKR